jgi:hypothetical protein
MSEHRVPNIRPAALTALVIAGFGHPPVLATAGLLLLGTILLAALLLGTDDRTVPQRILLMTCVLLHRDPRTALLPGGQARPAPRPLPADGAAHD